MKAFLGQPDTELSQARLLRWARRPYNPGFLGAFILFGFFGILDYGAAVLEGWTIVPPGWFVLDASAFILGLLLVFSLRDVPLPPGSALRAQGPTLLRRIRRLRILALGLFAAFLLVLVIDNVLLGPWLLVVTSMFLWTGMALCSLILAFTNRILYCPTCSFYGNFVWGRNGWTCTTCGRGRLAQRG